MTYLVPNETPPKGRKILSFLKNQKYKRVLGKPNSKTKFAIEEARKRNVKKAKSTKDLFRKILG